jgi:predicted DNA-binding protein (MmcQ/YjbR family)
MSKPAKSGKAEEKVLAKLREICSALPEVQEVKTWGHPTFKAGTKTFAVLETYNGHLCICFKATLPLQQLLIEDPRYFKTPYIGKQGWVSLIADTPPKWGEVRQLIRGSYELVNTKAQRHKDTRKGRITVV